jgi:hypothetical protein
MQSYLNSTLKGYLQTDLPCPHPHKKKRGEWIKTLYRQELNKIMKSGAGSNDLYKPN